MSKGKSENSVMKIGLYGGSFDPVHNGHLILARDAMEKLGLTQVIFLPAYISPHKQHSPPVASPHERCQMLAAAIQEEPNFAMDDYEVIQKGPSFTINTVRYMQSQFPTAEFFYFLGDDNLDALHTWKDIETLKKILHLIVLSRNGKNISSKFPIITRQIAISSTEVRKRIAQGLSVQYFIPNAVEKIIKALKLYQHK